MEQFVMGSKAAVPLQLFVTFATTVGGTTVPALADVPTGPATPLPLEANEVSEDSTDTPNQAIWPTSCTNRIAGWRAQLKPVTYCASMVSGMFSVWFMMPTRFWVSKLHI